DSEIQLTAIESRMSQLAVQEKQVRASLQQRHGSISMLLAAMQRIGRNPPPVMITQREDALAMVRSAMLLADAFPQLSGQAVALSTQLNDLIRVMTESRAEGEKLKAETARLSEAQTRLATLMETKRRSLDDRQHELTQVRAAADEIARSAADLGDLIAKLDKTVAEKTGLGAYENSIAKEPPADAEPKDVAAAGPDKAGEKSAEKTDEQHVSVVLAPSGDKLAMLTPGRIKPAIAFAQAKGLLSLPAQGRRVLAFGDKTQYGSQSKGVILETRQAAQVISPCDGWVVYADAFRSYGQLLIINGGGGYHVLLAGMSRIDVQLGQFVLAGEPVGAMSAAGQADRTKPQTNSPVLYVEFRKDGRPIDPDPWWAAGTRKVQG
ncbi:MAG: murein hydrolase activator EnvC, partial [Hyphomicrobiaceae bacterium]